MLLFSATQLFNRSIKFRNLVYCNNIIKTVTTNFSSKAPRSIHDVNTNVTKDVVLFKYENNKYFRYMNVFAIVQYMFWTYLGVFAFKNLKDAPVNNENVTEDTPWYRKINLGENKYKNTLGAIAIVVGTGSLAMIWMFTLRSVKFLILNKGGKHLTFVTYTPFGENRIMKVPIEYVSCKEDRLFAKVQLPLKVKKHAMHYMLDMRGEFKNPLIFDSTAGLARKW